MACILVGLILTTRVDPRATRVGTTGEGDEEVTGLLRRIGWKREEEEKKGEGGL